MKWLMDRILPRTWNDVLSVLILIIIPVVWGMAGSGHIDFARLGDLNGALIATWTLVVQYYFRRSPPTNGG